MSQAFLRQAAGHIHQGLVADQVGQVVDGPVQLRLCAVDVVPLPNTRCHHGCAYVDEDAPCQDAGQGLLDVDVHLAQLPLHQAQVPLDAGDALLSLDLGVEAYGHPQVFNLGSTWYTRNILDGILSQNLGLGLVESQVPSPIQTLKLLDSLGHLCL